MYTEGVKRDILTNFRNRNYGRKVSESLEGFPESSMCAYLSDKSITVTSS